MFRISRLKPCLPLLMAGIVFDLLSKWLAIQCLADNSQTTLLPGVLYLHLVRNNEGFLSIPARLVTSHTDQLLTFGVGLLLLAILALLTWRPLQPSIYWGLALVLAGGTANLVDRLLHDGAVIDILRIAIGPLSSGIFNLADLLILGGSFILGSRLLHYR